MTPREFTLLVASIALLLISVYYFTAYYTAIHTIKDLKESYQDLLSDYNSLNDTYLSLYSEYQLTSDQLTSCISELIACQSHTSNP